MFVFQLDNKEDYYEARWRSLLWILLSSSVVFMLIFHICAIFQGIYRKQECLCFELDNKVKIIMKLDGIPYLEYHFHSSDISFCGFFHEDETIFHGQGAIRCHYR